jgi:hypothetical protein
MDLGVLIALAGLGVAIGAHAFATIWWAAKVTYSLEGIRNEVREVKDELKEENLETKLQIQGIWKRQDEIKDRVLILEQNDKN